MLCRSRQLYVEFILGHSQEQRQRLAPEAGALHLTRASDLLELELPPPDLTPYHPTPCMRF